jgi:C-terminal processing protease CtpA/Prc
MTGMTRGCARFQVLFPALSLAFLLAPAVAAAETPVPPEPPPAPRAMQDPPVWLGVFLEDAADGGLQVLGLVPGGPAERGGVRAGDVLLGVAGTSVLDLASLNQTLLPLKPGQRAEIRFLRDGSMQTVTLLLGDRAKAQKNAERGPLDPFTAPTPRPMVRTGYRYALGAEIADMPAELRKHYGAPADAGALVVKLDPDGPAAKAGLMVGDVLVRAGERRVEGHGDFLAGLLAASTPEVPIEVVRSRKTQIVSMPRPAVPRPSRAAPSDAKMAALTQEVERLRARVAELEAELEKQRE